MDNLPDIEAEGERIANETWRHPTGMYLWTDLVGAIQTAIGEERARHRTASTAALTAEIQRLREKLDNKDALAEAIHNARFNGPVTTAWAAECEAGKAYCYRIANAVELHLLAALSTPSEVSEPVADHIGGEGESAQDDMLRTARELRENSDGDCNAIKQAMMWEERAAALATPPNTNGDAVREALVEMGEATFKEGLLAGWQSGRAGEAMPPEYVQASWERSDALATLAKHGGAEG